MSNTPATARCVPSRFASLPGLAFEINVPGDFVEPQLPQEEPRFEEPTFMMPLWVASSPVALALVTVSARPAYEDGSVIEWVQYLAAAQGLTLKACMPGRVGPHAAILAEATQEQDGTMLEFQFAAVQDGEFLFIVMGMVPEGLALSFRPALERAVASFRLVSPAGPRVPLAPGVPISPTA